MVVDCQRVGSVGGYCSTGVELVVFKDHAEGIYVLVPFKEAFLGGVGVVENLFEHEFRGFDPDEWTGISNYLHKFLFWSPSDVGSLDVVLAKIERKNGLHEPFVLNGVFTANYQINELWFLVRSYSEQAHQNLPHFLPR